MKDTVMELKLVLGDRDGNTFGGRVLLVRTGDVWKLKIREGTITAVVCREGALRLPERTCRAESHAELRDVLRWGIEHGGQEEGGEDESHAELRDVLRSLAWGSQGDDLCWCGYPNNHHTDACERARRLCRQPTP